MAAEREVTPGVAPALDIGRALVQRYRGCGVEVGGVDESWPLVASGNSYVDTKITGGAGVICAEFFGYHWRWLGRPGAIPSLPLPVARALADVGGRLVRATGRASELGRGSIGLFSRPGTYSIARARRLLGFDPQFGLAEGMRRTEDWVREQGLA